MASLAISQPELDAVPGHQHSSLVDQIANSVRQLAEGNFYLKNEIRTKDGFEEIVGESPALKRVLQEVEIVTIRNLINCW